ncbi:MULTISPECIES: hypothetical protein [unclassified Moorena]|nr:MULTISPECIES: hypothetical protein [unclassified Moorena]
MVFYQDFKLASLLSLPKKLGLKPRPSLAFGHATRTTALDVLQ